MRDPDLIAGDLLRGRRVEDTIGRFLPSEIVHRPHVHDADFEMPPIRLEVKSKLQPLADTWQLPEEVRDHAIVVDEQSLRRAVVHPLAVSTWWVLYDGPNDTWHLAHISLLASLVRWRRRRHGRSKLIFDLREIPVVQKEELWQEVLQQWKAKPWLAS